MAAPRAPIPKLVINRSALRHEFRVQKGTSKYLIPVPLIDLKSLNALLRVMPGLQIGDTRAADLKERSSTNFQGRDPPFFRAK